jgi:hypothetical protein
MTTKKPRTMIWGARAIAVALFGPEYADERSRRAVYNLVATGVLPAFRMGSTTCAWSDQIESFLESKAREAASNFSASRPRGAGRCRKLKVVEMVGGGDR